MNELKPFAMGNDEGSWRTPNFRQSVVAKIDEAIQRSGMPTSRNSIEMESHVFQKAKSKEDYLSMIARLILHVREMRVRSTKCMKRSTRKKSTQARSQTYQTGGGSNTAPPLAAIESKVNNSILLSADELESKFDSDVNPKLNEDISEIFEPEVVLIQSTVPLLLPSDIPLMIPVPNNEVVYTNNVPERPVLSVSPDIATSNTQTPHVSKSDRWRPAKLRTRKHYAIQCSKTFGKLSDIKRETALLQKRLIMEELKDKEIEERRRREFEEKEKEWACNEFIRRQKRKFASKSENLKWL